MNDKELKKLFDSLSFEEKLGQLCQLNYLYFDVNGLVTGDESTGFFTQDEVNHIGSVLNIFGKDQMRAIQKEHMKHNKTPLLFMADVTEGYYFNHGRGLIHACSFDTEKVRQLYRNTATEAAADGVKVSFYPTADIARDARWGRCFETSGEDVCLSCKMVEAKVKGFQGEDISDYDTMASCVKHFAAYGGCEGGRDYNNVELSDHELREVYLPSYKAAIDAGAQMVMTSFNTLGGVPMSMNKRLIKGILRDEWGFDGPTLSDYGAIRGCYKDRAANSSGEIAELCMKATLDIDMMDQIYVKNIPALLESGKLEQKLFDDAVLRVLKLKNKLGLLEDPYRFINSKVEYDLKEHIELATEVVSEGMVLLKNENNILPLKDKDAVIIGPYGEQNNIFFYPEHKAPSIFEAGHPDEEPLKFPSLADSLGLPYEHGCPMIENGNYMADWDGKYEPCYGHEQEYLERAVELAKGAKKVILTLGEHFLQWGEQYSRAVITLPKCQRELFDKIYEVNKNIILVLYSGRPLELGDIAEKSKAIICGWYPGELGGEATARIISGKTVPSGKLAMSYPYSVGQMPLHYDIYPTGHGVGNPENNWTSKYCDISSFPLYPFGYGLSYTTFKYSKPTVDKDKMKSGESIKISVDVTNDGDYDACEVVQLYLRDVSARMISRPNRQMKDFKRVFIKKGETKTVTFEVDEKMLEFYDGDCNLVSETGAYQAFVGADSTTDNQIDFYFENNR